MKIILSEDKLYGFAKKYLQNEIEGLREYKTKNGLFLQFIRDPWVILEVERPDSRTEVYENDLGVDRLLYNTIRNIFGDDEKKTNELFFDVVGKMLNREFDFIYTFRDDVIIESTKMKIILKESQIEKIVMEYLDSIFDTDNINWHHPYEYNDETGEEYEDADRIEFYHGDFGDEDIVFRWTDCPYFNPESRAQTICPEVVIEYPYDTWLYNFFGDTWQETFKKWFKDNFDLPIKTVGN